MYRINNLPLTAYDYKFIIFRVVDGEAWYYGADNDPVRAARVAAQVRGSWCATEDVADA